MRLKLLLFLFITLHAFVSPASAVSDPRSVPNNIVGINSLSPDAEIKDVASLVNTNGDWGYILIVIRKDERDLGRWQKVLNQAAEQHLTPIIRLATHVGKNGWEKPGEKDAEEWANFLSQLYFPTKNRYIQVYNEVNAGGEWGGAPDPAGYAQELNKTIDALKAKSDSFFILNSPLDLSLPTSENSLEASEFFRQMEASVPGIFNKLDGWASHSYPNPDFSAHPLSFGRIGIDGFSWELSQISGFTNKDLPVFITETGWKRENGILTEEDIASFYEIAFTEVWNDERIAAVTPFVFNYSEPLFDQFSFKKLPQNPDDPYYSYFSAVRDLPKIKGEPMRENLVSDLEVKKPGLIFKGMENKISFKFQNAGNYIWDTKKGLGIKILSPNLKGGDITWSKEKVYPGETLEARVKFKGDVQGTVSLTLQISDGGQILREEKGMITIDTPRSFVTKIIKSFLPKSIRN